MQSVFIAGMKMAPSLWYLYLCWALGCNVSVSLTFLAPVEEYLRETTI